MVACCIVVFFQCLSIALGAKWPAVQQDLQDALPNIELSLAPPPHIWPQVAAALGSLEESRETMENANMDKLQEAFNGAMSDARRKVGELIGRFMRIFDDPKLARSIFARRLHPKSPILRQIPQEALGSSVMSVKVNVLPASPPDPSLKAYIDDIESRRYDEEKHMLEAEAFGELSALTKFILNEFEVQVQSNLNIVLNGKRTATIQGNSSKSLRTGSSASFLQERAVQLPDQSNVRIVPMDVNYPSIASLVQDMEARRDLTENLERSRILEKELDLAMVCNDAAEKGLKAAVSRILAQYGPMLKASQRVV